MKLGVYNAILQKRTNLGGKEWANEWPKESAWDFEHEDVSLGRIEGLEAAAGVLKDADAALTASLVKR